MTRRMFVIRSTNVLQSINVNMRLQIQVRPALVNTNAVGAGPIRTRAGGTRLGGAGTRLLMAVADSLVRDSILVMLFPVDHPNQASL